MEMKNADYLALRALGVGKRCDYCGYVKHECICAPITVPDKSEIAPIKIIRTRRDMRDAARVAFSHRIK